MIQRNTRDHWDLSPGRSILCLPLHLFCNRYYIFKIFSWHLFLISNFFLQYVHHTETSKGEKPSLLASQGLKKERNQQLRKVGDETCTFWSPQSPNLREIGQKQLKPESHFPCFLAMTDTLGSQKADAEMEFQMQIIYLNQQLWGEGEKQEYTRVRFWTPKHHSKALATFTGN